MEGDKSKYFFRHVTSPQGRGAGRTGENHTQTLTVIIWVEVEILIGFALFLVFFSISLFFLLEIQIPQLEKFFFLEKGTHAEEGAFLYSQVWSVIVVVIR